MRKMTAGQGLIEYSLVVALVAIVLILAANLLGVNINALYCKVAGIFSSNACSGSLCSDNFASLGGEQITGGWTASGNQACISGTGTMFNTCSRSASATDYTATASGASLTTGNGYGIFFRVTQGQYGINGYAFQYDPGAKSFVIRKWVNGSEIFTPTLAQVMTPAGYDWYGAPHTLSVKVVGNTFTGYVDGQPVITATDSTYTSGGIGLRTWDSTNLCLNSFSLTTP